MTVTTIDSNHGERDMRKECAIVGKYRQIGQLRSARNRSYAEALTMVAAA